MNPQYPPTSHPARVGTGRFTENLEMDQMVDIELGAPSEPLPSYRDTQTEFYRRKRTEHAESKRKQCRRARKQQIIILIIALALLGGLTPLVVMAFKKNQSPK